MVAAVDAFLPPALQETESEARRRARMTVAASAITAGAVAAGILLDAAPPASLTVRGVSWATVALLLCAGPALRLGVPPAVVQNAFTGLVTAYTIMLAAVTGGRDAAAFLLAALAPLVGVLLCGARAGAAWSGLLLASLLGVALLADAGAAFPVRPPAEQALRWGLWGSLVALLAALGLALTFDGLRLRALRELAEARRREARAHRSRLESEARFRDHLEDLVERRTLELERSRSRLRQSERLATVGTLAAGIAHQINNPLASILAASQYALACEDDADVAAVRQQALRDIEEEARRGGRIVRSVLQFSRNQRSEKWLVELNEVVRGACALVGASARECDARLETRLVVPCGPVELNPLEMEQALVNVVRNALQASPPGARVRVATERRDGRARIRVEDEGRGIPAGDLHRIFDPFYTTRLSQGGTGLGLAVAHGIVSAHGGSIDVESRRGRGTAVTIDLPLSSRPAAPGEAAPA